MRHKLLQIKELGDSVFTLRLERNSLAFKSGQFVTVGTLASMERREYTVYSSPDKEYLELLIKDIDGGDVSGKLHRCRTGEELEVGGPFGKFIIPGERRRGRFLFVATGTGIAPFHCFVDSYQNLDYRVLHGVRDADQLYGHDAFDPERLVDCLSRSNKGRFYGRVTDYLKRNPVNPECYCYLCGNSDMIYQVFDILLSQGIARDHLFTEVYF